MNAVRVRRHLESETLHLPELRSMIGQMVEIIILPDVADGPTEAPARPGIETRETFLGAAADVPPIQAGQLDAMRTDPTYQRFWTLFESIADAGPDAAEAIDVDAIVALRAASSVGPDGQ